METTVCQNSPELLANSTNVDAAANQKIIFVGPRVEPARFFWRQNGKLAKAGIAKPVAQLFYSMVILIFRRPPVECVAHAIFIAWVGTKIDHFIQRSIHDWKTTNNSSDVTEGREDFCRQSSRAGSQSAVD